MTNQPPPALQAASSGSKTNNWCIAHGVTACTACTLNPSTCGPDHTGDQDQVGCGQYGVTGMHYDTCPNRIPTHRELVTELFQHFATGEKGHPGRPCIRTHWINESTVTRWATQLQALREVTGDGPAGRERIAELEAEVADLRAQLATAHTVLGEHVIASYQATGRSA